MRRFGSRLRLDTRVIPKPAMAASIAASAGFRAQFAQQQSWAAHVRYGSKADIEARSNDVRFTPGRSLLCDYSGLDCLTGTNGTTGAQRFFAALSHRARAARSGLTAGLASVRYRSLTDVPREQIFGL